MIVGRSVETFEEANYATLVRYYDGTWKYASTNQKWAVFWTELSDYDGETVVLEKVEGRLPIQETERYEFVQFEQEKRGLLNSGVYETRLRPYFEEGTEAKPWNPGE